MYIPVCISRAYHSFKEVFSYDFFLIVRLALSQLDDMSARPNVRRMRSLHEVDVSNAHRMVEETWLNILIK